MVNVVLVIKVVDTFVAMIVALVVHMAVNVINSVLVTNRVDAVVAVAVDVVVRMLTGCRCSLSCQWYSRHPFSLSRLRPHTPIKLTKAPVLLNLPVLLLLPKVVKARVVLAP